MLRYRRGIQTAVLLLAAGFGSSVGVAWLIAWRADLSAAPSIACYQPRPEGSTSSVAEVEVRRTDGWGMSEFYIAYAPQSRAIPSFGTTIVSAAEFPCWPWSRDEIAPELSLGPSWPDVTLPAGGYGWIARSGEAAGWPMICLEGTRSRGGTAASASTGVLRVPFLSARRSGPGGAPLELPLGPVWSGLAVNTVAHASGWFVVLLLARRARSLIQQRRRAAGKCPACRYPMIGLAPGAPCPECGTPSAEMARPK